MLIKEKGLFHTQHNRFKRFCFAFFGSPNWPNYIVFGLGFFFSVMQLPLIINFCFVYYFKIDMKLHQRKYLCVELTSYDERIKISTIPRALLSVV